MEQGSQILKIQKSPNEPLMLQFIIGVVTPFNFAPLTMYALKEDEIFGVNIWFSALKLKEDLQFRLGKPFSQIAQNEILKRNNKRFWISAFILDMANLIALRKSFEENTRFFLLAWNCLFFLVEALCHKTRTTRNALGIYAAKHV